MSSNPTRDYANSVVFRLYGDSPSVFGSILPVRDGTSQESESLASVLVSRPIHEPCDVRIAGVFVDSHRVGQRWMPKDQALGHERASARHSIRRRVAIGKRELAAWKRSPPQGLKPLVRHALPIRIPQREAGNDTNGIPSPSRRPRPFPQQSL
jgi:hypothetical protein